MEGLKLRTESMLEAHMTAGDKPGQVKIEIRPVKNQAQELEVDIDELESVKETINRFKDSQWKTVNRLDIVIHRQYVYSAKQNELPTFTILN